MQPVCGIPGERIESAVKQLDELAAGESETIWLYPILFLCGLKYGITRFSAKELVGHIIDDELNEMTQRSLAVLLRISKSKSTKEDLKMAGLNSTDSAFAALKLAFVELESELPPTANNWLARRSRRGNFCRLAVSMGVRSVFESKSYPFLNGMTRAKFIFINGQNQDCGSNVKSAVESFIYDPSWALPP